MDHERLERLEYFGGMDGKDSLSLLLVMVDQFCCHFMRADHLRCSFMSDRESGVMVSGRFIRSEYAHDNSKTDNKNK